MSEIIQRKILYDLTSIWDLRKTLNINIWWLPEIVGWEDEMVESGQKL